MSDYQTFVSSAVTFVGLLMGISHYKEVKKKKKKILFSLQTSIWLNMQGWAKVGVQETVFSTQL